MKYIRTKADNIYKLSNDTDFEKTKETYVWCFDKKLNFHFKVDTKYIINQADTIEELCDTIVIVWKDNLPTIWNDTTHFKDLLSMYSSYRRKYKIVAIYGAIWTDKGLIYVAKLNEKGELELL